MKVVLKLGYYKWLFPAEVLSLLDQVYSVDDKRVDKATKYFVKENDDSNTLEVIVIQDSQFVQPGTQDEQLDYKKMFEQRDKDANDYCSKKWETERERDALKKEIEVLKSLCPETHKNEFQP